MSSILSEHALFGKVQPGLAWPAKTLGADSFVTYFLADYTALPLPGHTKKMESDTLFRKNGYTLSIHQKSHCPMACQHAYQ